MSPNQVCYMTGLLQSSVKWVPSSSEQVNVKPMHQAHIDPLAESGI